MANQIPNLLGLDVDNLFVWTIAMNLLEQTGVLSWELLLA